MKRGEPDEQALAFLEQVTFLAHATRSMDAGPARIGGGVSKVCTFGAM